MNRETVSASPNENGKVRASHAYVVQFLLAPEIALMVLAELRASIGRWLTDRSVIPLSTCFARRTHLLRVTCGTHVPKSQKWRPRSSFVFLDSALFRSSSNFQTCSADKPYRVQSHNGLIFTLHNRNMITL